MGSPWNWVTTPGSENQNDGANEMRKKFDDIFSQLDTIHQRVRRTDGQTYTGRQHRPRLRIASRGKNANFCYPCVDSCLNLTVTISPRRLDSKPRMMSLVTKCWRLDVSQRDSRTDRNYIWISRNYADAWSVQHSVIIMLWRHMTVVQALITDDTLFYFGCWNVRSRGRASLQKRRRWKQLPVFTGRTSMEEPYWHHATFRFAVWCRVLHTRCLR